MAELQMAFAHFEDDQTCGRFFLFRNHKYVILYLARIQLAKAFLL